MVTVTPSSRAMTQPRTLTDAPNPGASAGGAARNGIPWQQVQAQALVTRMRLAGSPAGLAPVEELFLQTTPALPEEVLGFLEAAAAPLRFMVSELLQDGHLHPEHLHRAFADKGRAALDDIVGQALSTPPAPEAATAPAVPEELVQRRRKHAVLDALRTVAAVFAQEADSRAPGAVPDHYKAMARHAEARAADVQREMAHPARSPARESSGQPTSGPVARG
jgi:hypothetical protein